jgi:hypothetical protein
MADNFTVGSVGGRARVLTTDRDRRVITELDRLRKAFGDLRLSRREHSQADRALAAAEAAARQSPPDRQRIWHQFETLVEVVHNAGSPAAAGTSLLDPLYTLAGLL